MRAAIYTRISSDAGTALGVARQEQDCRTLAAHRGWSIVGVYVDNDVSASASKPRPAYRRLLDDISEGLVDAVIVWDLDRLHRRPVELEEFLGLADQYKVALASVGGDVDLATPQGRMVARIKGAVARQEVEQISRRLRRKQLELAQVGKVGNGGIRPFGYTSDRMHVMSHEAEIIREAASRVLVGESLGGIAADLTARGIPTVRGGPWSRTSLRELLLRPRVAGLRQYQGNVIGPAAWPAILDRDTYEGVRATLTNPQRRPPGLTNARKHLLSGIATCGACGSALRIHHGGASAPLAYSCQQRGCGKVRRSLHHLDEFVTGLIIGRLTAANLQSTTGTADSQLGEQIAAIEARLEQVAIDFADDPDVTADQVRVMTRRLRNSLDELQARQAERLRSTVLSELGGADLAGAWASLSLSRRRAIISVLAESVIVLPTIRRGRGFDPSRIDIRWR
jgi:DNA invertase Pin-like site-specific DNA recombinase